MITGICKQCGKTTTAKYKSQLKTFCSIKCANQWKWNHQRERAKYYEFKCENCGKPVFIKHGDYRLKSNSWKYFCSRECSFKYHVGDKSTLTRKPITYIDKVCPICGIVFKTPKSIKNKCCCKEHSRISNAMTKFCKANNITNITYEEYLSLKELKDSEKAKNKKVIRRTNYPVRYSEDKKSYMKMYYKDHYNEIKERARLRIANNPLIKVKDAIRKSISLSIIRGKYMSKRFNLDSIIGCSYEAFIYYIESKFKDGMSWSNYGKWHIDHIIPLMTANSEEDVLSLCNYQNLQPLWAEENYKKGRKIQMIGTDF